MGYKITNTKLDYNHLSGYVMNTCVDKTIKKCEIAVAFKDDDGRIIDRQTKTVTNIPAKESRPFEVYSKARSSDIDSCSFTVNQCIDQNGNALTEGDSTCYITTAICRSSGKPDDCYELELLRRYRDEWLTNQEDGPSLINRYYETAPKLVERINRQVNSDDIYEDLNNRYLKNCITAIENGDHKKCKEIYVSMVNTIEKLYS